MRIVALSDTHLQQNISVADGDVLVFAGDATWTGNIQQISSFNKWFSSFPHKHKIVVAGNHDRLFEENPTLAQSLLDPSITYLQSKAATIDGVRFFGSPYTPEFCNWAFGYDKGLAQVFWGCIPDDTDVLITHGPPKSILDGLSG